MRMVFLNIFDVLRDLSGWNRIKERSKSVTTAIKDGQRQNPNSSSAPRGWNTDSAAGAFSRHGSTRYAMSSSPKLVIDQRAK